MLALSGQLLAHFIDLVALADLPIWRVDFTITIYILDLLAVAIWCILLIICGLTHVTKRFKVPVLSGLASVLLERRSPRLKGDSWIAFLLNKLKIVGIIRSRLIVVHLIEEFAYGLVVIFTGGWRESQQQIVPVVWSIDLKGVDGGQAAYQRHNGHLL